jgi:parallel beta-helix repeat protein
VAIVAPYYSVAAEQGAIEGWVVDSSTGLPLVGANVTALCTETPTIFYSTTTNELGQYQFPNVEAREYIITAFGKYGDVRYGGAKKCKVTSGQTVTINFTLTPIPIEWTLVPVDYGTIQGAINTAKEGDTVFVCAGTYYEHIVVNKSLSLIGEDKYATIIDGGGTDWVIFVEPKVENLTIEGFTVRGGGWGDYGSWHASGIYCYIWAISYGLTPKISISNNVIKENNGYGLSLGCEGGGLLNISNNIVVSNWLGLSISGACDSFVSDNIIANNTFGLYIGGSPNCTLRNNTIIGNTYNFGLQPSDISGYEMNIDTSNTVDGRPIYYWVNKRNLQVPNDAGFVALISSVGITVKDLSIKNNIQGIFLAFSQSCLVENATITSCYHAISMYYSFSNEIKKNTISDCNIAIAMESCSNNFVAFNSLSDCVDYSSIRWGYEPFPYSGYGVLFSRSCANHIHSNKFGNLVYGMRFYGSYGNKITLNNISSSVYFGEWGDGFRQETGVNIFYHNNFYASVYFGVGKHTQIWDNGYPSGGNYWAGYTGEDVYKGPFQNETGSDGIGDTPYIIPDSESARFNRTNKDNYPLMKPCVIPSFPPKIPPSQALLSVNVFKNDVPIDSNIAIFDENKTLINTKAGVFSFGWILPFGKYYVQASIAYDEFIYTSEMIEVNLTDYTELAINFKFGMLTISCFDIKSRPLKNCILMLTREGEQTILCSDDLGMITLEAYYGNWTVKTYWMGVLVGETEIVLDEPELDASIVCNVGDLKVIVVDQYGNLIKANVTLTNATYGLTFSGYLDGIMEHITFTQIPLINYTLAVKNDIETSITVDASKTTEVVIPEFPSTLILLTLITLLTIFVIAVKKKIGDEKVEMG